MSRECFKDSAFPSEFTSATNAYLRKIFSNDLDAFVNDPEGYAGVILARLTNGKFSRSTAIRLGYALNKISGNKIFSEEDFASLNASRSTYLNDDQENAIRSIVLESGSILKTARSQTPVVAVCLVIALVLSTSLRGSEILRLHKEHLPLLQMGRPIPIKTKKRARSIIVLVNRAIFDSVLPHIQRLFPKRGNKLIAYRRSTINQTLREWATRKLPQGAPVGTLGIQSIRKIMGSILITRLPPSELRRFMRHRSEYTTVTHYNTTNQENRVMSDLFESL